MDRGHSLQHGHLETFMGTLRQHYPGSCLIIVKKSLEHMVIQLDQFVITITGQGTVEVTASTNSHQLVEQLSIEVEQLLNQTNAHTQSQESQ